MTNVRLYRESLIKQRLEEEMNLARRIQMDLLPKMPPSGPGYAIAAHSQPSRTVGGDFYDFVPAGGDGGFGLVVADVSGKGMPAALLAAQIQAVLRSEVINRRDVAETMTNVNNLVAGLSSSSGKFATVFYGAFHPATREFVFSNAGHNYPVLVRADGRHEFLETGGTVIGAFEGNRYQSSTVILGPNDLLFFYTDGLSEAHNAADEEFGEQRIIDYIVSNRDRSPNEIRDGIIHQVTDFVDADVTEDDTTVIVLKMNG
jgi:sigma-B regulation protein RsbU (phosphoserine phosphatase)